MPNYQNGKIYKLVSKDSSHNLIYIGSTCQDLRARLGKHKADYKRYLNNKITGGYTSFRMFEKGEVDIILIEDYPCQNKSQLFSREYSHIQTNKCVNKLGKGINSGEHINNLTAKEFEFLRRIRSKYGM